jgi:hypothetical protein
MTSFSFLSPDQGRLRLPAGGLQPLAGISLHLIFGVLALVVTHPLFARVWSLLRIFRPHEPLPRIIDPEWSIDETLIFHSVSKITVSVFAWPSQRPWNWEAPKPLRLPPP